MPELALIVPWFSMLTLAVSSTSPVPSRRSITPLLTNVPAEEKPAPWMVVKPVPGLVKYQSPLLMIVPWTPPPEESKSTWVPGWSTVPLLVSVPVTTFGELPLVPRMFSVAAPATSTLVAMVPPVHDPEPVIASEPAPAIVPCRSRPLVSEAAPTVRVVRPWMSRVPSLTSCRTDAELSMVTVTPLGMQASSPAVGTPPDQFDPSDQFPSPIASQVTAPPGHEMTAGAGAPPTGTSAAAATPNVAVARMPAPASTVNIDLRRGVRSRVVRESRWIFTGSPTVGSEC